MCVGPLGIDLDVSIGNGSRLGIDVKKLAIAVLYWKHPVLSKRVFAGGGMLLVGRRFGGLSFMSALR